MGMLQTLGIRLRRFAPHEPVTEMTRLLHRAYKALADMGFNYTATDQTDETTRRRIGDGECWVGERDGVLVSTITMAYPVPSGDRYYEFFRQSGVAHVGQFAVEPALGGQGVGREIMLFIEDRARELGATELAGDTSEGAAHLRRFYGSLGFREVGFAQWPGKTYRSVILSKRLTPPIST